MNIVKSSSAGGSTRHFGEEMNREVNINMLLEDGVIKPGDGVLCLDIQASICSLFFEILAILISLRPGAILLPRLVHEHVRA